MRQLIAICIGALALALAGPAGAVGAFIEGKVLPPGIHATVTAQPAVAIKTAVSGAAEPDGSYRLEVAPGITYHVVASAPGYAYAAEEPAEAAAVSVAYDRTATLNFDLVPAATVSGVVSNAGEGAVVVAMRRSSLPRRLRFAVWAHVERETGRYTIPNLRPGIYDLVVIASERGIVDGRGWLLGRPDTLSPAERKALLAVNAEYAQARLRQDYGRMLAVFSREFSDTAGNTYDTMVQQAAMANPKAPGAVVLSAFTWEPLLLQGDGDSAMAVATQVTRIRHRGVSEGLDPERADLLVEYRREDGAWRFYRMEAIRAYRDLGARITRLTGRPCVLPAGYVVTYSDDLRLGCIALGSGDHSTGHDYTFPGTR